MILSVPDERGSDYINASYINVRFSLDMLISQQLTLQCHIHISVSLSLDILQGEHGDVYIASQGFHVYVLIVHLFKL